ncbi:MAG TPA: FtsX-like permease family protein [Clostridiales bacterium]|nr:FtsX-like permease family protein [Clostridiales bacterium]
MVNMLQRKIFRDILAGRWSFIAVVCICTLGIALFSGLNLYVSTMENSVEDDYKSYNLADYWIYKTDISELDLERLQALPDVEMAQRRKLLEVGLSGGINATLRLHATQGQPKINIPELLEGQLLDGSEPKSLLLDSRFAEANRLKPGDTIQVSIEERQENWQVKGIIRNAEYIYYAPDGLTVPDYQKYGFAYVNASALPDASYNELILSLNENTQRPNREIMEELRDALGSVNIIDRQNQPSSSYIADDLEGIKQIGVLFPIAFFLIAALVTWVTVGRMMENQRQHLGTLRSLGFPKREIMGRYSLYGILITVPSMLLGWLISRYLAKFLYGLGIIRYTIAGSGVDTFSVHFFVGAIGVAFVTCGAALLSCKKSLKSTPSALMRPKPPAQGRRILLERIPVFWRSLSFSGKIVTRNLFRNKARMIMGLMGIIGSTALILCGFGMKDSTDVTIDRAFTQTMRYDAEIKLKTPMTPEDAAYIYEALQGAQSIDATMAFGVYIYGRDGGVQNPYLVVMDGNQSSLHFSDIAGKEVILPDNGVLITPRMAKALDVGIGSVMRAERLDGTVITLEVANIIDFPVGNEIYISRTALSKVSPLPFTISVFFINGQGVDFSFLHNDPRIALIETKSEMEANMMTILEMLGSLQMVLIIFAGLLAFAVMMVLGIMNYHERIRELATLKVLGFHQKEMKRLVLRENIWITIFGLPFGVIAGFGLVYMMQAQTTNPDMEISPFISATSIVLGCALILAFTLFVNYIMGRKFKGIDMISSLKSVE